MNTWNILIETQQPTDCSVCFFVVFYLLLLLLVYVEGVYASILQFAYRRQSTTFGNLFSSIPGFSGLNSVWKAFLANALFLSHLANSGSLLWMSTIKSLRIIYLIFITPSLYGLSITGNMFLIIQFCLCLLWNFFFFKFY